MPPSKEEEIFNRVLTESRQYFDYDLAGYLILKEKGLFCKIESTSPVSLAKAVGIRKRMLNSWLRWNPLRNKKVHRKIDLQITQLDEKASFEKLGSYISAPLLERNKVIGIIAVISKEKRAFSQTAERVLSIVSDQLSIATEKARLFSATERAANRDELTGVWNFRYFDSELTSQFELARKKGKPISLIMLDFDHLKQVNDTYGHGQGNRLITVIAHLIEKGLRSNDVVGRFGGDEFGIILPETPSNTAYFVAERIRKLIASHKMLMDGKASSLTASLGVAIGPKEGMELPKDLLKEADLCLYQAKEAGRNRVWMR